MLALVPLLVPVATAAATGIAMLLLLWLVDKWFTSWADNPDTGGKGLLGRVGGWVAGKISRAVKWARKRIATVLSHGVANSSAVIVRALETPTELILRTGTTLQDSAAQTYAALYALRHVTMPAYVTARLDPVWDRLNTTFALAKAANDTLTAISVEIANGLRDLPWGVPVGLPNRVAAWFNAFDHLWTQFFGIVQPRVNTLWNDLVPQLRRDVDSLLRGGAGNIGTRLRALELRVDGIADTIAGELRPLLDEAFDRILAIEADIRDRINLRLDGLQLAIDTLAAEIFTGIGTGLTLLTERVVALEREVFELIPVRFIEVWDAIGQLREDLENGIETGVEAFRARIEQLEFIVDTIILPRLDSIVGRLEILEAEVFNLPGGGLGVIIGRIEWLENQVQNVILPQLAELQAILAPAALAALVLEAMRTAAPNLFCNPVTDVTSRLCRTDEAFLRDLLAGTLLFALILDPRIIARSGQAVTEGMSDLWRATALQ